MNKIPVSVIVVTKNEEAQIARCLKALSDFAQVIVVDSKSTDQTIGIAQSFGAQVVNFTWKGRYPKKKQWCLDHLEPDYDWVFFLDADEVVTPALVAAIRASDFACAGYFVRGRYVVEDKPLRFGLHNNKLALFDRRAMCYPVVDDLDLAGIGEVEGHYQPVFRPGYEGRRIGQFKPPLLHYAYQDPVHWHERHKGYALWERGMNARKAWPTEPNMRRRFLKWLFRTLPLRPFAAFLHSYVLCFGFMEGRRGWILARDRFWYYAMIDFRWR